MRILYVQHVRIPTEKAHGRQMVRTIDALAKKGVEVTLLVPKRKNSIKEDVYTYYGVKKSFSTIYLGSPFSFLEQRAPNSYFTLSRTYFGIVSFFYTFIRKEDVIFTRNITFAFFISIFSWKVAVFEDHEPKRPNHPFYAFFLRHIKKKIIVARGLDELYRSYGVRKESFVWIPNGVSIKEILSTNSNADIWSKTFGIPRENKIALYVGHFYAWKGVYTLLDAAQLLPESVSVILIGGTQEENTKVRAYVEEHALRNVYIHDFLPQREVIAFMKSAHALVLPNTAKEERSNAYTTPIKLFEYMASGVPIVASDIESLRWFLRDGDNAVLCKADDPKSLSESIKLVLDNPSLGDKIQTKALEESHQYTWENRAERIISFLTS